MRPVFHWTAKRINAHIAICFIAFALIRFLQHKVGAGIGENMSAERIKREKVMKSGGVFILKLMDISQMRKEFNFEL